MRADETSIETSIVIPCPRQQGSLIEVAAKELKSGSEESWQINDYLAPEMLAAEGRLPLAAQQRRRAVGCTLVPDSRALRKARQPLVACSPSIWLVLLFSVGVYVFFII